MMGKWTSRTTVLPRLAVRPPEETKIPDEELAKDTAATAEPQTPRTALEITWSNVVQMLDLGTEPEMRACPECKHLCPVGATRCVHGWSGLPALEVRGTLAA